MQTRFLSIVIQKALKPTKEENDQVYTNMIPRNSESSSIEKLVVSKYLLLSKYYLVCIHNWRIYNFIINLEYPDEMSRFCSLIYLNQSPCSSSSLSI